jgi:hypothetical protein
MRAIFDLWTLLATIRVNRIIAAIENAIRPPVGGAHLAA